MTLQIDYTLNSGENGYTIDFSDKGETIINPLVLALSTFIKEHKELHKYLEPYAYLELKDPTDFNHIAFTILKTHIVSELSYVDPSFCNIHLNTTALLTTYPMLETTGDTTVIDFSVECDETSDILSEFIKGLLLSFLHVSQINIENTKDNLINLGKSPRESQSTAITLFAKIYDDISETSVDIISALYVTLVTFFQKVMSFELTEFDKELLETHA